MLYYLGNARTRDQYDEMVRLEEEGICIFCPDHLGHEGGKEIIAANDTWSLVFNDYPYPATLHHVMLIPKQHVTKLTELSAQSQRGYWDILQKAAERYGPDYFVLASRNGNPRYTGATIAHLHMQFIVGDPDADERVIVVASSKPSDNGPPPA